MAWTTPSTWVSGAILTAAQLNTQVRDNMDFLKNFAAAWTTFTPQLRTATTNRTSTVVYARYLRVGSLLVVQTEVTATAAGGANEIINLALPTGFTYTHTASLDALVGTFHLKDTGTAFYAGNAIHNQTGYIYGLAYGANNNMGNNTPAMTMASGDVIGYNVIMEITPT